MRELTEQSALSRSNLTRLVDRLEETCLVERGRSAKDRRGADSGRKGDAVKDVASLRGLHR
jgi:hypothetical protein